MNRFYRPLYKTVIVTGVVLSYKNIVYMTIRAPPARPFPSEARDPPVIENRIKEVAELSPEHEDI
jgi:hypothetical protein